MVYNLFIEIEKVHTMKYTVHLTNMWHSLPDTYTNEVAAIEAGKKTGFEFSVHNHGVMVGYFTIFGGYHTMDDTKFVTLADDHDKLMADMQCTTMPTDHTI